MQALLDLTSEKILVDQKIEDQIYKLMDKYGHIRLQLYFKFGISLQFSD